DLALVLNPDVRLGAGAVELLVDSMVKHPRAAVASPLVVSDETGRVEAAWYEFNFRQLIVAPHGQGDDPDAYTKTREVPAVAGVAWMFRLDAFEDVGDLNEEFFLYHEDVEWCYRAGAKGYRILLVPQARAYHTGFRSDPKGEMRKAYFIARNSVLFAKRWLTGTKRLKFWTFLLASIPVYFLKGAVDERARWLLKGAADGIAGRTEIGGTAELGI
ncbi:MAG TPA: glycosyltransferase family 2 protein, partial [Proteobacteria bacterium]|nr:glycosyltransferase family 2 protein [Pseudomonadota bacterium]